MAPLKVINAAHGQRSISAGSDNATFHTAPNTPAVLQEDDVDFAEVTRETTQSLKKPPKPKGPAQTDAMNPMFSKKNKSNSKKKKGGSMTRKPSALPRELVQLTQSWSTQGDVSMKSDNEKLEACDDGHLSGILDAPKGDKDDSNPVSRLDILHGPHVEAGAEGKKGIESPPVEATGGVTNSAHIEGLPPVSPKRTFLGHVSTFLNLGSRPRSGSLAPPSSDLTVNEQASMFMPPSAEREVNTNVTIDNALGISGLNADNGGSMRKKHRKKSKKKGKKTDLADTQNASDAGEKQD
ncbi:hypothetical protein K431DRAFT_153448 [Polychaeton citri CBS 116435]|uniref:Uncharacterized protein n=1 Tax=Polychaeton citri CBS 116435 TaxID=1314669 RepID=A0A9P4Q2V9_9PEZI|nr:hypothetical protein K431DRAFT_153448 [Polychaeton citri CBS 116435]